MKLAHHEEVLLTSEFQEVVCGYPMRLSCTDIEFDAVQPKGLDF